MTIGSVLVIRRYVIDRSPEMTVTASNQWKPVHAEPYGVTKIVLWAIEETFPERQVEHVLLLVGGIGGVAEIPLDGGWNGHIATWVEDSFDWHLFSSARGPRAAEDQQRDAAPERDPAASLLRQGRTGLEE